MKYGIKIKFDDSWLWVLSASNISQDNVLLFDSYGEAEQYASRVWRVQSEEQYVIVEEF